MPRCAPHKPPFFGFTPVIPQFYWDVESAEERIEKLCCMLYALQRWAEKHGQEYEDLKEDYENFKNDVSQQLADLWFEMRKVQEQMQALAQNALVYDVTTGLYRPSMATSRRMWQAGHYFGMSVADYATYTVAQTGEYNMSVRHVAVDGRKVYMGLSTADDAIPMQTGYSVPCFIPDDYIKRSDLTYIDSDNLQEHTIMGVLDKDAASGLIKPTPYARPYTAHDLANTWVLYNDHLVADIDNECEKGN